MPTICCIRSCKGTKASGPKTSVFCIPRNAEIRKKWIRAINNKDFEPSKSTKVCELHFMKSDFENEVTTRDSQTGIVYTVKLDRSRKRLKADAVPSIFPDSEEQDKSKALVCERMLAKKEWSWLLARKYRILQFWKENPDYALVRPGPGRAALIRRRSEMWQELTDILDTYEGQKRTAKEWIKIWNGAKAHIKFKISKRIKLTDFEVQLADFFSKCGAKGYKKSKDKNNRKPIKTEKDSDCRTSECDYKEEENISGNETEESDCSGNQRTSYEQRLNLLAYWKHHHLISGSSGLRNAKERRDLWREATLILNNCQGPKRSWREWSDVWSSWKNNVKRRVELQKKMNQRLDRKLAEYILETDHLTSKHLMRTYESHTEDANIIQTVKTEVSDHSEDDLELETGDHLNYVTTEYTDYEYCDEPSDPPDADFSQYLLQTHTQNLDFQEEILFKREALMEDIEESFQDIVDCVELGGQNNEENMNPNSNKVQIKQSKNAFLSNALSKVPEESEFDSFAKNVMMQLKKLPLKIALEARKLISEALEDSSRKEMSESDGLYIIEVLSDGCESEGEIL